MSVHTDPARRHDFVLLFDVTDGNPNGDPDADNLPRFDPETMQGIVTDVSIKRKIRDAVAEMIPADSRYKIYIEKRGDALNTKHQRAYDELSLKSTGSKQQRGDVDQARDWMCANFFDVRMFGAVMTTGVNCGQVRGPVQLTFGRSIDPVVPTDLSITRVAITKESDAKVVHGDDGSAKGKETEMGRKPFVPYGLYRMYGFFNANLAAQTGVTQEDLETFWGATMSMFELDRSASRGFMAMRDVIIFSHDNKLGNAPAHRLFERVTCARKPDVKVPRSFADYEVRLDDADLPDGITPTRL